MNAAQSLSLDFSETMSIVLQFKPAQVQEKVDSVTQLSFHVRTYMCTVYDV